MTHHKCAYSEVVLGENSTYIEINHFYPKSLYPDKVVEWGNCVMIAQHYGKRKSPNLRLRA